MNIGWLQNVQNGLRHTAAHSIEHRIADDPRSQHTLRRDPLEQ